MRKLWYFLNKNSSLRRIKYKFRYISFETIYWIRNFQDQSKIHILELNTIIYTITIVQLELKLSSQQECKLKESILYIDKIIDTHISAGENFEVGSEYFGVKKFTVFLV
eukprot:TRINITY_DN3528_c0_g1_i3.p4 TRINITY_DN3528_c0_g1~~TRINITY_DN3528_c0_g1_i3.p4  ORF type:complete len:109 (-),score=1.75 TRINITY_DN3528_c0_g1_i3:23-349(-)